MGLFSSKTKYIVNVTVSNVFEPDQIPKSAKNGITKALFNGGDIQEHIMEELSNSIGVRAGVGYQWAVRTNYPTGLPKSDIKSYISAQNVVKQAIESNIGRSITFEYYRMAPLNAMHFGWDHCFNQRGYDPATNELKSFSALEGKKCYLANMVVTIRKDNYDWMLETDDMGCLDQLGPPPNSGYLPSKPLNTVLTIGQYAKQPEFVVSSVATEDYITITYEFEQAKGVFVQRSVNVTMAAFDDDADYHMARYKDSTGKTGFFTYMHGSGTYPLVDMVFQAEEVGIGTYYPWTYFRLGQKKASDVVPPEELDAMTQWCRYLGVDYKTMDDAVEEDVEKEDVSQVMMCFGVSPGGQEQSELEYLFKHFDRLHANALPQPGLVPDLYGKMNAFTSSPSQKQRIKDKRFAISYQFSGLVKVRRTGKIAAVGQYKGTFKRVPQNAQTFATQGPNGAGTSQGVPTQKAYIYQHQVNATVYDEIAVYNLRMNYEVHRKKGFAAGGGDPELLIPCDRAIVETVGLDKREDLLCRSLKLMVNTVIKTKQPWYASSAFKFIMMAVAVVVTIVSMGAAWQSIVAAAAIGVGALALTVLTIIVQGIVISFAVKMFVNLVGPEMAIFAAVVAVAYGAYTMAGDATWGERLIGLGTNLSNEASDVMNTMYTDAVTQLNEFNAMAIGAYGNLAEKKELLGLNSNLVGLEPFDFVNQVPMVVLGESPSDLYNRTVHSGNIGAVGIDSAHWYHDTKLALPTLNETQFMMGEDNGLAF